MLRIILKNPEVQHREEVIDLRQEFFANEEYEIVGGASLHQFDEYALWLEHTQALANREEEEEVYDMINGDVYLVYDKYTGRLIGILNLKDKYDNTDEFYKGQVFYSVRPTLRNNNYGQEILAQAIEMMSEKHQRAIISIPKHNPKIQQIIERYDGIFLRDEIIDSQNIVSIYMFMF